MACRQRLGPTGLTSTRWRAHPATHVPPSLPAAVSIQHRRVGHPTQLLGQTGCTSLGPIPQRAGSCSRPGLASGPWGPLIGALRCRWPVPPALCMARGPQPRTAARGCRAHLAPLWAQLLDRLSLSFLLCEMGENSTCLWAPSQPSPCDRRTDGRLPAQGRWQESQAPNPLQTRSGHALPASSARCFPADLRPLTRRTGPPGGREQGPSAAGQVPSPSPAAARGLQLRAPSSPGGDGARGAEVMGGPSAARS
uniref:Uncharacterized protein n=1 Tax=Myotis myotis TaxID=51298 RepID=A0A7J7XH93_MYOMY|nr:hypothetical protein mMyoMyo1_011582 [Myotis myotis]